MKHENSAIAMVMGMSAAVTSVCILFALESRFNWDIEDIVGVASPIWISILFGICVCLLILKLKYRDDAKDDFSDLNTTIKRNRDLNSIFFLLLNTGVIFVLFNKNTTWWFYVGCLLIFIGICFFTVSRINKKY